MTPETDELMTRLRAADPAAPLDPAAVPDRAALARARRGRAHGRTLRVGVGGSALALAGTLLLAIGPSGGGGGGLMAVVPSASQVLAKASDAAELPAGSIVVLRSIAERRGGFRQERTTWVRTAPDGRRLEARFLVTRAEGENVAAGVEEVSTREGGRPVLLAYDPRTRAVTRTLDAWAVPSVVLSAQQLLRRAQRGDRDVTMRATTFEGRKAWALTITGVEEPALRGDRDELIVDGETYQPLLLTKHSEGLDVYDRPFTYDFSERIVSITTLRDTAESREQLRMHGPTG